jgi:phosphate-selective porin OprO/OprP
MALTLITITREHKRPAGKIGTSRQRVRGWWQALAVTALVLCCGQKSLAQAPWRAEPEALLPPISVLEQTPQPSENPDPAFAATRLADYQPLPPLESTNSITAGSAVDQAAFANDRDELAALAKKVRELEQRLQKNDDRDQKAADKAAEKAASFPTWRITGFTQLDGAYYSQDALNRETVGDAQDGWGFRRARLAVQGNVAPWTAYQLEMDFATAGRPSFFDCYIDQGNLDYLGIVRVGQFCQPFSVDSLTGFRNLTFLERSLPFLAFVPFRRVGIQSSNLSDDESTALAYSVFRTGGFNNAPLGDDRFATDFGDVGGYSFSTRLTHLLMYDDLAEDRYLWHIGGGYNFSQLGANDAIGSGVAGNAGSPKPFYQARTGPEFGLLGYPELNQPFGVAVNGTPAFVDTGRYEAEYFNLFGVETVYQAGPWGITSEYMATIVESVVGPIYYNGAYVQVAYRLTGENRVYDKKNGTLGKLVPFADFIPLKRDGIVGWGAWEIAGRYSFVDLTNPDSLDGHYYDPVTNTFTATNKRGNGVLQDTTVGLTWFLNVHTKIQFNWIHAMLDNTAKGNSEADLFVMRFQVDF